MNGSQGSNVQYVLASQSGQMPHIRAAPRGLASAGSLTGRRFGKIARIHMT